MLGGRRLAAAVAETADGGVSAQRAQTTGPPGSLDSSARSEDKLC